MAQRHKWADVIIAFAEGKEIQFKNISLDSTYPDWTDTKCLYGINYEYLQWRVKPEKKTGWINIYPKEYNFFNYEDCKDRVMGNSGGVYTDRGMADKADAESGKRIACIQIEYEEGQGL